MVNQRTVATMRCLAGTAFTCAFLIVSSMAAQSPATVAAATRIGTIRGTVFDSLTMSPAVGALVWIASTTKSTTTDDLGKFVLEDVPTGSRQLMFSSTAIDSTGLGALTRGIDVSGAAPTVVALATPSFGTLWHSLCAEALVAGKDSGIVWGTIRDAHADTRLSGAAAVFRWYDLHTNAVIKRLEFGEMVKTFRTDSIGNFYACGLPADIAITTQGAGERSASGALEHVIGLRRVVRLDLSVSRDMVLAIDDSAKAQIDTTRITHVRGTSTLRGIVRDDKGKPMPGATVTFATADTSVRSGSDGSFVISAMPAGTHAVQAKQIGFRPVTMMIDLKPESVTQADLQMFSGQALATFNVRADTKAGADRAGYLERRRSGYGYAIEDDFSNRFDVLSILGDFPEFVRPKMNGSVELRLGAGFEGDNVFVTPENLKKLQEMPDRTRYQRTYLYIDGIPSSVEQLQVYKPELIRAVEFYPSRMLKPWGFSQGMDGNVILVWTKKSRW